MPVAVLVGQVLAVAADGLPALFTRVGVERLKAGHTVGVLLPQDVLLPKERLIAVVAIKALCHVDTRLLKSGAAPARGSRTGRAGRRSSGGSFQPAEWSGAAPP